MNNLLRKNTANIRGIRSGGSRTKCDNCPGKSRSGQWIEWYGKKLYLCPRCLIAARNVMKEASA